MLETAYASQDIAQEKILVAVSGGSDSLALLYHLHEQHQPGCLFAATVDHGLRPEAAREAQVVAEHCSRLNIPHAILRWKGGEARQEAAREARFWLLAEQARKICAPKIALGHTMDDQAETLIMRAARVQSRSSTRGLSGIPMVASYEGIQIIRPLLFSTRAELRRSLQRKQISWADDPSNENPKYERVRVRQTIATSARCSGDLPSIEQLSRLAALSSRSRAWLSWQTAQYLKDHANFDGKAIVIDPAKDMPTKILSDVIAFAILTMGGQTYRTSSDKYETALKDWKAGKSTRVNAGRALISFRKSGIRITREKRNIPPFPSNPQANETYDNRFRFLKTNGSIEAKTFIVALERFRPASDDAVYRSINHLMAHSRST